MAIKLLDHWLAHISKLGTKIGDRRLRTTTVNNQRYSRVSYVVELVDTLWHFSHSKPNPCAAKGTLPRGEIHLSEFGRLGAKP